MHEIKNLRQALRFLAIAKEKIKALEASEAALKEQVAQLDKDYAKRFKQMELETLSLQSKSAALVDAAELVKKYRHAGPEAKEVSVDLLVAALAAFKEKK